MAITRNALLALTTGFLLILVGCGDESTTTETGLTCGDGTVEDGGVCLPATGELVCGAGTVLDGSECVVDGAGPGSACGPGTKEVDGVCELDPDGTPAAITCGEGTEEVDGICQLIETEPVAVSAVSFTSFSVETRNDDNLLVGYHPVSISFTLEATSDSPFSTEVIVGLVDESDESQDCFVGLTLVDHPGTGAITGSIETTLPEECFTDDDDGFVDRVMNPAIVFDPDGRVVVDEETSTGIDLVFNSALAGTDADAACSQGASGASCITSLQVKAPAGVDFVFTDLEATSSVVVLGSPSTGVVDNGLGEMVYGLPELQFNAVIEAYGAKDYDHDLEESLNTLEDHDLAVVYDIKPLNAEEEDSWLPIYFHEQGDPAKADEEDVAPARRRESIETQLETLARHHIVHGLYVEDHCGTPCGDDKCTHNDICIVGGYCKLDPALGTDPDTGGCDAALNARSEILTGAWQTETNFLVRACLSTEAETSELPGAKEEDSNCQTVPIKVVRYVAPAEGDANTKTWGDDYSKHVGSSSTVKISTGVDGYLGASKYSGGDVDSESYAKISSSKVGTFHIAEQWCAVETGIDEDDTEADRGFRIFGFSYWTLQLAANGYQDSMCDDDDDCTSGSCADNGYCDPGLSWTGLNYSISKEKERKHTFYTSVGPVKVEFEIEGEVGLEIGAYARTELGDNANTWPPQFSIPGGGSFGNAFGGADYFSSAAVIGVAWAGITPYAVMTLEAEASINYYIAKASVEGTVDLFDLSFPIGGRLAFGAISQGNSFKGLKYRADIGVYLDLTLLSGKLKFKVKTRNWRWKWKTRWTYTVASFSGWNLNQTIISVGKCGVSAWKSCALASGCLGNCN